MTDLLTLLQRAFDEDVSFADKLANDLAVECDTLVDAYQHLEGHLSYTHTNGNGYGLMVRKTARRAIRDEYPRHDYTRQFALIGCSSSKRPGYLPAREKYDPDSSPYWKWKRTYAEVVADRYWILSAEYGVLNPTQYIGDYDRSLSNMNADETETWARQVGASLEYDESFWSAYEDGRKRERYYDEIVVVAGQDYVNPIRETLDGLPIDVRYPFEDEDGNPAMGGIGAQTSWLKERAEESHARRREYETHAETGVGQAPLSAYGGEA
jgi:hypothetical protein